MTDKAILFRRKMCMSVVPGTILLHKRDIINYCCNKIALWFRNAFNILNGLYAQLTCKLCSFFFFRTFKGWKEKNWAIFVCLEQCSQKFRRTHLRLLQMVRNCNEFENRMKNWIEAIWTRQKKTTKLARAWIWKYRLQMSTDWCKEREQVRKNSLRRKELYSTEKYGYANKVLNAQCWMLEMKGLNLFFSFFSKNKNGVWRSWSAVIGDWEQSPDSCQ